MRQFEYDMRLDRQLALGELGVEDMLELATEIARQHLDARKVEPSERLSRVTRQLIFDNYKSLAGEVPEIGLIGTDRRDVRIVRAIEGRPAVDRRTVERVRFRPASLERGNTRAVLAEEGPTPLELPGVVRAWPSLLRVLEPFERYGISLTRIETRPARSGDWSYVFFIDFDGHQSSEAIHAMLEEVRGVALDVKTLGSYPRAVV